MRRVYVGIDIGSKQCSAAAINSRGKLISAETFRTSEMSLISFVEGQQGEVKVLIEEGELAGWVMRTLLPHTQSVEVSDPKRNAWIAKGANKSDRVDAAKTAFSEGIAAGALLFTGTKRGERGPAPIAALWLTGDPITLRLMRAGDTIIEGGPYLVSPETKKPGLKAMLNQRLIQAGVEIIKSGFDAAVITAQNQLTAEQVQGFVNPGLDLIPFVGGSADSHVDYIVQDGNLYLDIKVSKM